ncbi:MAG: hypothetical protein WKF91_05875 [Segetibacter sp.]
MHDEILPMAEVSYRIKNINVELKALIKDANKIIWTMVMPTFWKLC